MEYKTVEIDQNGIKSYINNGQYNIKMKLKIKDIHLFIVTFCIIIFGCNNNGKTKIGEWELSGLEGKRVYEIKRGGDYLYATTGNEGLYRKQISSGDWQYLGLSIDSLIYGVVTSYFDTSTATIYAGIYEPTKNITSIYRSKDDGGNWEIFDDGLTIAGIDDRAWVLELTARKENPQSVYAGTEIGVYKLNYKSEKWNFLKGSESYGGSEGYGVLSFNPISGVLWVGGDTFRDVPLMVKMENDTTWVHDMEIHEVLPTTDFIYDIKFSDGVKQLIYACAGYGLIVKENQNGQDWTLIQPLGNQVEAYDNFCTSIELNPKDSNEIIVSGLYLYRSFDGGETWEIVGGKSRDVITDMYIDWAADQAYASITNPTRGIYKINLK